MVLLHLLLEANIYNPIRITSYNVCYTKLLRAIIKSVEYGIYAESFTNGQVMIGAGDFTFYVKSGFLIENGVLTKPIKDVNIIGNGPQVLKDIVMVADDLQISEGGWTCGKNGQGVPVSQGLPTIKVAKITVGGVNA